MDDPRIVQLDNDGLVQLDALASGLDNPPPLNEAPRVPPAARRRKPSIAVPASRFIGRAGNLAALSRGFAEGRRLVTVWGPAGMGKTRLARELALGWAEDHPDEAVCFCELEAARESRGVLRRGGPRARRRRGGAGGGPRDRGARRPRPRGAGADAAGASTTWSR